MQDISKWLTKCQSDGVNLGIKELIHYQGKTALLNLSPRKTVQAKLAGAYLAKTKGRGMEFDEARHYQAGDDIRAIDWRVTARTGKTHTKLYREEKERPVFVLTDLSSSMQFGTQFLFKSVQAAHLSALIAWSARKRGDRIGGLVFNQHQHLECKPYTRQKAVLSLLNSMIKVQQGAQQEAQTNNQEQITLGNACARLRRLAHPGSLIFILSDFSQLDELAKQHIAQLSKHCEVIAYPITDPFEHQLPHVKMSQRVTLSDGHNRQQIVLGEKDTEIQYSNQHQARFDNIENTLKQCKAQVIQIDAGHPLELQLDRFSGSKNR
ncbi:DUF58 domain-containing protein [Paraglaciecola psychrophila]|jgi:uncharacterized protein (DUF58 family)|uniref:DUF58 domain-containing protein n=1 Tax=Paraglaciecola psychrophila 170 TaxID=1129794 RepID=K7A2H3_9ALTE|nr:DUF58 domain-containing protein [Paraglaciecola psychrophila]AGH44004.1 hypothetical protein C427_1895 [Paraglaciecola psychrophila 170]GAC36582.1 hypothetical protein GPSY_0944 [Paraglaciecola psychrophila 170]